MDETSGHRRSRLVLAALMVFTGLLYIVVPEPNVRIIPRFLRDDWARPLVYASGVAEVASGLALVPRRSRRPAARFVAVLLILVFPANVQMALDAPGPLTIGRLPLQAPLIWWAWRQSR